MATIRSFETSDAENVAQFYNKHGLGSVTHGIPLTGATLLATIREEDVRLLVIAEQYGSIVGTLGYARMSGRRVSGPAELFATMFLVEPSLRAGFLVGQLFADSFARFSQLGVRTLRVEVDPANRRAFPLYVRIGFRNIGFSRADEDGYMELVNHLPGVASTLSNLELSPQKSEAPNPQYTARTLKDARRQTLTSGVVTTDSGQTTITYELQIDSHAILATVDAVTGQIMSINVDGTSDPRYTDQTKFSVCDTPTVLSRTMGEFTVSLVESQGALSVWHPRHLGPLMIDPFPVADSVPAGSRRPAASLVTTTVTTSGWISTDGRVTRVIEVGNGMVTASVSHCFGADVTVYPWSGFRSAELSLHIDGQQVRSAHSIRGIWPPDVTDFESAADEDFAYRADGLRLQWFDRRTGIGLEFEAGSPGSIRIEGPHLARIAGASVHSYKFIPFVEAELSPRDLTVVPKSIASGNWERARVSGLDNLRMQDKSSDSSVAVSPSIGMTRWRYRGRNVLASQGKHTVGPLTDIASALWVAEQHDRTDPDQGVEWAQHDSDFAFGERLIPGWSVIPSDDFMSLDIEVHGRNESSIARELAVYLLSPWSSNHVEVMVADNEWLLVDYVGTPWRTWVRAFRVPTAAGYLEVWPLEASHPEILLRADAYGVLATMLGRISASSETTVRWRLTLNEITH
ncbi:GNAT family N-acetyltransferase [Cryobacterium sp. TMS1-13-1]|uniref:GNAT family N-acetyltransferase n=1 Tax=Cryobacterium sp. TMS1-13-1 TaxID=1259220 RepID=UPI00106A3141|nr:hypothetical protein [Cryobacterium sp. TMS1-13-1]TFD19182.1 hypothetical protein E3T31_16500 [Cryobacterium sp. TMS1-13-1]